MKHAKLPMCDGDYHTRYILLSVSVWDVDLSVKVI